jgi:hypothetical protein
MNQDPRINFLALPNCPHLTYSWCGYSLLSLEGLSPDATADLTSDKVTKITVNGGEWETRPMGDKVLMLIPAIKQEAQRVAVYFTGEPEAPKAFRPLQATTPSPKDTWGFTARQVPEKGGL